MSEPILIMTNIDHGKENGRDHKTVNLRNDGKCRNAKYTHKIYAFLDKSRGFPSHQKAAKFKNLTIRIEAQLRSIDQHPYSDRLIASPGYRQILAR